MTWKRWLPHAITLLLAALLVLTQQIWAGPVAERLTSATTGSSKTTINYQGYLTDSSGNPVNDTLDMVFRLYNVESGGEALWAETQNVEVNDGLFSVLLGSVTPISMDILTDNTDLWLGIAIGTDEEMSPREKIASVPYAMSATEPDGGTAYWSLTGNDGTTPGTHFLGTTDGQALELRVNNARALRLEPDDTSPNFIGGYSGNSVTAGVVGATISGGGRDGYTNQVTSDYGTVGGGIGNQTSGGYSTVGGGANNTASDNSSTVAGGAQNTASGGESTVGGGANNITNGTWTTVGGGSTNEANGTATTVGGGAVNTASQTYSTVGGGYSNEASGNITTVGGGYGNTASGNQAAIGGGWTNTASGLRATVGGGRDNAASGGYSTVGGGDTNTASGYDATIGGGKDNTASESSATVAGGEDNIASNIFASIGGGLQNQAGGNSSTVPGGWQNTAAGDFSFAAGKLATVDAAHEGVFLFADSEPAVPFNSAAANEFAVRATGGVRFVSAVDWYGNPSAGVRLVPGAGSWSSLSDRNLKENFAPVDGQEVLARLAEIPITTWNYQAQNPTIRHMGPMAQDFYTAFGLGEDDKHISSLDAESVALAAIQGLYAQNLALETEKADLRREVGNLQVENVAQQAQLDALEARLSALEAAADDGTAQAHPPQSGLLPSVAVLFSGVSLAWLTRWGGALGLLKRSG